MDFIKAKQNGIWYINTGQMLECGSLLNESSSDDGRSPVEVDLHKTEFHKNWVIFFKPNHIQAIFPVTQILNQI